MKKNLIISTLCLFILNINAQKINPKEYATITYEMIDGKKSFITPVIKSEGTVFTPNGEFLFIVNGYDDKNGNVVVYDLAKKSIIKKFKIKKTGIRFFSGKIICNPDNMNQLALVLNKNTIKVIQNWQTAPEDILLQKSNENLVSIKAKADKGQIAFSKDGKNLFLIENEDKTIKSIDLATGEVSKQTIPDNKTPYIHPNVNTFIGNNEIIVFNDATKSSPRNIEIVDLVSRQVVRKHELKNYLYSGPSHSHLGNPHLVSDVNEITFNLNTGDVDYTFKTIRKMVEEIDKDANVIVNQIPGIGFVAAYYIYKFSETTSYTKSGSITTFKTKSGHGLFFTDNKGNLVYGNFPSINTKVPDTGISRYQISPNGKFIIFNHDGEGWDNDGLVIATLY